MSRKRITYLIVPLLVLIPVVALAIDFDWTAQKPGDFDDENNWTPDSPFCGSLGCYPHTCNDDATIEGPATVYMSTETIDDLTLAPTPYFFVTFDGEGSEETLTCDSLTITGEGTVFLTNKAIIKTKACP